MIALLLILTAMTASAQVSAVTVTYDAFSQIRRGILFMGGGGAKLGVTAVGAWTLNKGTCGSRLVAKVTSGTGNTTIAVNMRAGAITVPSGQNWVDNTCSGDVGGVAFSLTERVYRQRNPPFVTDMLGSTSLPGTKTDGNLFYNNAADHTAAYPPTDGVALPAVCSTWTDPLYGGVFRRVSSAASINYGSDLFSRSGRYIKTEDGIMDLNSCTIVAPAPWLAASGPVCSGSSPNVYWTRREDRDELSGYCIGTNPATIKAWHITGGTVVDDGVIKTFAHAIQNEDGSPGTGGSGNQTGADDAIFLPFKAPALMCYFEMWRPSLPDICAAQDFTVRGAQIAPLRDHNGDRYMHFVSTPPNPALSDKENLSVFRLRNGALTLLPKFNRLDYNQGDAGDGSYGIPCVNGNDCSRAGHHTMWSIDGVSGRFGAGDGVPNSAGAYIYSMPGPRYSADSLAGIPYEGGGGMVTAVPHADDYLVCAQLAPVCLGVSDGGDETRTRGLTCTLASTTLSCTVGTAPNPDGATNTLGTNIYTVGQRLLLNGFSVVAWNGYKTVATSSGSTITFTGQSGAGTSLAGFSTIATTNTSGANMQRAHHIVFRADVMHGRIVGKGMGSTNASYSQLPLGKISPNGTWAAMNDGHWSYPGEYGVRVVDAGFRVSRRTRRRDLDDTGQTYDVQGVTNGLAVKLWASPAAACTLTYSKQWDYQGGSTRSFPAGSSYRTDTITGLTPGDIYYTQMVCDGVDPTTNTVKPRWLMARYDDITVK